MKKGGTSLSVGSYKADQDQLGLSREMCSKLLAQPGKSLQREDLRRGMEPPRAAAEGSLDAEYGLSKRY